ncbi:hypothetical protein GH714_023922 [Hevea brasiliensis]|uniref:Uncharacterized protein n=1 Tax=Hevea brasiliensis TaxID=3981 RepID=A0A6A6L919_HEVBR|nr:hypothetical protein GH714_023922 [Hevea brasiliensis]
MEGSSKREVLKIKPKKALLVQIHNKNHGGDGEFDCEASSQESSSTTEMDACPPSTTDPSTTTDDPVLAGAPPRPSVSTGSGPRTN